MENVDDAVPEVPNEEDPNIFVEGGENAPDGNARTEAPENATEGVTEHKMVAGAEYLLFALEQPAWVYGQPAIMVERTLELYDHKFGSAHGLWPMVDLYGPTRVTDDGTMLGTVTACLKTDKSEEQRALLDQLYEAGFGWLGVGRPPDLFNMTRKWPLNISPLPAVKEVIDIRPSVQVTIDLGAARFGDDWDGFGVLYVASTHVDMKGSYDTLIGSAEGRGRRFSYICLVY